MAQAITWDGTGQRYFELGVDRGVFFPMISGSYGAGQAWNGLTTVTEKNTGGDDNKQYADNIVYANIKAEVEFEATIEAFTYPDGFAACDGSAEPETGVFVEQQPRVPFGFTYRTLIGNDVDGVDKGYKLHLIWNATAEPSEKSRETINESPEGQTFSWDLKTEKTAVSGYKPTAHVWINSLTADPTDLKALEDKLYGVDQASSFPTPDQVLTIFS